MKRSSCWIWVSSLVIITTACSLRPTLLQETALAVIPVTQLVVTVVATSTIQLTPSATDTLPSITPTSIVPLPEATPPLAIALTFEPSSEPGEETVGRVALTTEPDQTGRATPTQVAIIPTSTPRPELPTPTASATAISHVSLPPPVAGASPPRIYETTISIPTYGYEIAFIPTDPENPIYPYPELDFALVQPPVPRPYRAVVLENGFVSVTILPELGGRIYRWVDKATGRRLLYENPVVKPTHWGYRGWWLAAGGIEWAFPVDEHGLNEWRPWQYSAGSTAHGLGITVRDVEDRTGMEVGATISLGTNHAYLVIQPWAKNNTDSAHSYQLWLNAMLALNGNTVSGQTEFIVPTNQVIVHSTGDGGLPGAGGTMGWPVHNGRQVNYYSNWNGWLGFFAPNVSHGFTALYDHAIDQGIVRVYNPGWPAGTKFFGPATISSFTWTDDYSNYVELWSGATASFWSYATLNPGETVGWTEYWYPVNGIGGLTHANRAAALKLDERGDHAEISLAVSGGVSGRVVLFANGHVAANWPITISPGQPFRAIWARPDGLDGPLGLRLEQNDGSVLIQTGFAP
jgi:hypothetical protein